jgi:hypothetical protein
MSESKKTFTTTRHISRDFISVPDSEEITNEAYAYMNKLEDSDYINGELTVVMEITVLHKPYKRSSDE